MNSKLTVVLSTSPISVGIEFQVLILSLFKWKILQIPPICISEVEV